MYHSPLICAILQNLSLPDNCRNVKLFTAVYRFNVPNNVNIFSFLDIEK